MDEIEAAVLTQQGFKDIEDGVIEDEEMLLIMRSIQSAEALERPYRTEDELAQLLEWYQQVKTDELLISMTLKGHLFFVGFNEDDKPVFSAAPQGLALYKAQAEEVGADIPEWMNEHLPSLDD